MHDLKEIRDNPDAFDAGLARRGLPPKAGEILALDAEARRFTTVLNELQNRRNAASKGIGAAKGKGDETEAARLMKEVEEIKGQMPAAEAEQKRYLDQVNDILAGLPNLPDRDVPQGRDETSNEEVRRVGEPKKLNSAKEHFDIGEALGGMDFETAAAMSGARFVLLKGQLARLERALASFMLDLHTTEFGYTEAAPPLLVKDEALFGTGQLPKFAEDLFRTTGDHWLIPTAEVSLTNIVRDKILDADELPLRFTAWTPCFRSEAGAAGRDTRGMIRMHQFSKVELVSITRPEQSNEEHERMTGAAEEVLKRLGLPFRTMLLCTGDMGFSARKTYDIEVWLPGQNRYREISSCSNCGDFQARRMKARFRAKGEKGGQFVHTLNGSGLAVGRTLVAVLENYQEGDGSVSVPEALQPYMGGLKKIEKA
ncbi:MAG: serine--tRNA ligase [Pseudomonadota bacterium]|nr:serine--tRNA ligase [Pseudomonadota bacterium]